MSDTRPDTAQNRTAELERRLQARTFELEVLHDLSAKLGNPLTYEELSLVILTHLGKALAHDVAASLLTTDNCCNLHLRASRPLSDAARREIEDRLLAACNRLARTELRREDIRIVPAESSPDDEDAPEVAALGSFFQVPIIADGVTVGLIFIGTAAENQFAEEHIRLLYTVANQAANAVRQMNAFLETERGRLATVMRHLPEGVVLMDGEKRVLTVNPTGLDYLREFTDGSIGQAVTRIGSRSFAEVADGPPQDLIVTSPEHRVVLPSLARLNNDTPECWLLVFRDMTDARDAVSRRDKFLAMLAHELRNPLAALTTAAELLQRAGEVAPTRERATAIIARQSLHLKRLVDDLLDASRFLHGKVRMDLHAVDLIAIVRQITDSFQSLIEEDGKRFEVELPAGTLTVMGDPDRLIQVFDNLLSNARKYTNRGESVRVTCCEKAGHAVVRVTDDGIGIPSDKLSTIFEPFEQVDESLDRSAGGLGLGLAVVKTLVTKHGGEIAAHSEGVGHGSEFVVQLPLAEPAQSGNTEADRQGAGPKTKRILIVEDDADVRTMLESLLSLLGHEVRVSGNGRDGVKAFREFQPDLGLVDIGLPEMNGYAVAQALQDEPHRRVCQLVALSGYAGVEDRERARRAGFDHHLAKPVQLTDLDRFLV